MTDPWRRGTDPAQRLLRIATAVTCLGVFALLAIDPATDVQRLPVLALAVGALLVLLGYERLIRLPMVGRGDDEDEPKEGPK